MKIIKLVLSSILLLLCSGFFYFSYIINNISNDNRSPTDSIVVFGNEQQNLYSGVQLLKSGYAPIVFITGNKPLEEYTNFLEAQKVSPERFIFDQQISCNESNHAVNAIMFIEQHQLSSMRLVVSAYQLPRALLELNANATQDITIIPHPIFQKQTNHTLVFKEYAKYILVIIASFIGKDDELNLSYS
jgi:uncharacterized SAM-binding protein YcdF (DUF218 family)